MSVVQPPRGRIVTFYSYKGGTGRSMMLANVAWILASNGMRVMVIDWDLEAPGLHRYFHPFLRDKNFASTEGLIDFIVDYASEALTPPSDAPLPDDWYVAHADLGNFAESLRTGSYFQKPGTIDFVAAGRQSEMYAATVNRFNWQHFYDKLGGGAFFEAAKQHIRADYDYILIDSRTGVSDTSGICTIQMPDTVVICFTLNIQSLEGASAAAEAIESQRRAEGRDIRILPVPTRVDRSEKDKVELARVEAWRKFDRFLRQMTPVERTDYWAAIEIPYEPWYSFEEVLAPFGDRSRRQTSVLAAMEALASYVSEGEVKRLQPLSEPERQHVLDLYLRKRDQTEVAADVTTRGEQALARLSGAQQREALSTILRLADFPPNDTRVATRAVPRKYLGEISDRAMQALEYGGLVKAERLDAGTEMVELTGVDVLQDWSRIRHEIESDRPFLSWRQKFDDDAILYEMTSDSDLLLRGARLKQAQTYFAQRPSDFSECERDLMAASTRRRWSIRVAAVAAVILPLLGFGGNELWRRTDGFQVRSVFKEAPAVVARISSEADRNDALEKWIYALVGARKVDDARAVVKALRMPVGQAIGSAALASAYHENGLGELALQMKDAAEKALEKLPALDRARAEIRVAEILAARYSETATRLANDAYETTRDPAAMADAGTIAGTSFGADSSEAWRSRLELFASVIALFEKLRLPNRAAQALTEADKKIVVVSPIVRADWFLDLANKVEESFRDKELAMTARRKALLALNALPLGTARERALLSVAMALTEKNVDISKCWLLLDSIPGATPSERYGVTARVVYAVPHWRLAGRNDAIWDVAESIAVGLPLDLQYDLLAQIATARAASGDSDAAQAIVAKCLAIARSGKMSPGPRAEILAGVSEAEKRLSGGDAATRSEAVSLALQDSDLKRQSHALMRIATAAVRSDAPDGEVTATLRLVRDPFVLRENLPAVVAALADVAAAAKTADTRAATERALSAAALFDRRGDRDLALKNIVDALVGAAKYADAVTVALRIADDEVAFAAFQELKRSSDPMHASAVAITMRDAYRRASARLTVAERFQATGKPSNALSTLQETEDDISSVGDANKKSELFGRLAAAYANLHDLRNARRVADQCGDSSDRLLAFATIVTSWSSGEQQPKKTATATAQKMYTRVSVEIRGQIAARSASGTMNEPGFGPCIGESGGGGVWMM